MINVNDIRLLGQYETSSYFHKSRSSCYWPQAKKNFDFVFRELTTSKCNRYYSFRLYIWFWWLYSHHHSFLQYVHKTKSISLHRPSDADGIYVLTKPLHELFADMSGFLGLYLNRNQILSNDKIIRLWSSVLLFFYGGKLQW